MCTLGRWARGQNAGTEGKKASMAEFFVPYESKKLNSMSKLPKNIPGADNILKRDPDMHPSSSYQKRESEPIAREDTRNTRGAAGSRGSYVRGNMQDYEDDYDPRNMDRNALQSEFGGRRDFYPDNRDYPGERYRGDYDRRDPEGYYEPRYRREENYSRYEGRDSFPEDRRFEDYYRRQPGPVHRGYRENQGQYSANNYDSPRERYQQGGMNYDSGRDRGYSSYRDEDRRRNYDGDSGGYNPEREAQTHRHFGYYNEHPRYRQEDREYGRERDRRYYDEDYERENRWRSRRENERW